MLARYGKKSLGLMESNAFQHKSEILTRTRIVLPYGIMMPLDFITERYDIEMNFIGSSQSGDEIENLLETKRKADCFEHIPERSTECLTIIG